jgi:quercetin dioxygenase-like cupin family protein
MKEAQRTPDSIPVADPLAYVRVYSDASGASRFADDEFAFHLADFAPPAPPVSVTGVQSAEGVVFLSSPSGWFGDWHPAPRRQFIFVLAGTLEVEVSDGETRWFGAGSVVLVEDTSGQGHVTRVTGEERAYLVAVPLTGP